MASIQKRFLKRVKEAWRREYPFLKPVNLVEVPRLPNGSQFLCDSFLSKRGRAYFVWFDFSLRRIGEFSLRITVSDSPERCIREHGMNKPSALDLGMYAVGQFGAPKRTWALVDIEGELDKFYKSLDVDSSEFRLPRSQSTWFPSSFELGEAQLFDEAIADVGVTLKQYVFPVLQIGNPASSIAP